MGTNRLMGFRGNSGEQPSFFVLDSMFSWVQAISWKVKNAK